MTSFFEAASWSWTVLRLLRLWTAWKRRLTQLEKML
jgi:hypothetical protein